MKTNHTEAFNAIMNQYSIERKPKQKPIEVKQIQPVDNMTNLQDALSRCTYSGNVIQLPFERLEHYAELRKALLNAGATYKNSTFIFPSDAEAYINRLMGGDSVNIKKEFQFFGTPEPLADEMVLLADIRSDHTILEPSAGQGAIIKAIHAAGHNGFIDAFELMDINRNILFKIPLVRLIGSDFLNDSDGFKNTFDRIIANPPFNKNQDIDHIYKMFDSLKPGGRMVTIASNSWRTGSQKKQIQFREWLESVGAVIDDIPAGAFKESGTNIATCRIIIDK